MAEDTPPTEPRDEPRTDDAAGSEGALRIEPVTLETDGNGRLPEPVEVAAYFVVAEALTNVAKYARATEANVALHRIDGRVTVDVTDDGIGGADAANGSGLRGIADRIAALDGTLSVESPPGHGTHLHVEIPC